MHQASLFNNNNYNNYQSDSPLQYSTTTYLVNNVKRFYFIDVNK